MGSTICFCGYGAHFWNFWASCTFHMCIHALIVFVVALAGVQAQCVCILRWETAAPSLPSKANNPK